MGSSEVVASTLSSAYEKGVLPHLSASGAAHMVDVGDKPITKRRAIASALVRASQEAVMSIENAVAAKGDVLATARVAAILAAKRTPEIIPLCHPVQTSRVEVALETNAGAGTVSVRAVVEALDRTGVEMEALMAVSVAALTVYDMIKATDRWASIEAVRLEEKEGGKSGHLVRPRPEGSR
jgi:cyclic pyranopterin phosphate synthase